MKIIIEKILALRTPDCRDATLARRLNLPYTTLHSWRRGQRKNPKLSTLENISSALGCSVSELIDPAFDIRPLFSHNPDSENATKY
jgi:transcriptional regulator with XRE-family HTH domain